MSELDPIRADFLNDYEPLYQDETTSAAVQQVGFLSLKEIREVFGTNFAPVLPGKGPCRDADPNIYIPKDGEEATREQVKAAKAVCAECPAAVKVACLTWAFKTDQPEGIWGGLTKEERAGLTSKNQNRMPRRRAS